MITTASYTALQVCRRHRLRECTVLLLFASLLLQSATAVAPPAWWTAQQVLAPGASSDDYALANIGQLKTIAKKAAQQMNTILLPEGGAGAPINALVQSWQGSSGQDRDDYSIVTIGQVKTVAQLFYTRLGITPPWEGSPRPQDDYAAANIGQLKTAFAFPIVLSGPPIVRTFPTQPAGGFQIPAPAFNAAARLWAGLATTPAGSSDTDFDGDGIPNDQEYRMSLADPVNYPMSKAMIDPDDWDGDGLLNTEERYQTSLSPLNFADAMQDADGDGLVNYDEIKLLVAGYNTDYLTLTSIRDSHQPRDPDSGASPPDFLIPPDCPLTDGQIIRWRRDIARSDFIPGTPGGDMTDEFGVTTHTDPTYPAPAPDTYRVWEDLDDPPNNLPDGYDLWLAQLPAGDTNPNTPAGPDVDADAMPNLWEHRYRLAFYDASNAGNASQWLIPQVLQVRSSFSDADYATLLGTIPHFDDLLRWNASIMAHEASQDPDHDTSVNLREYLASTNPLLADSDGDGYRDDVETTLGSDPAVYSDSPKKYPLVLTILSGTGQSGHAGSTLISPLKVKAERNGLPSVGEVLTFSSTLADFSSSHASPLVLQAAADGTVTTTCTLLLTAPEGPVTVMVSGDGAAATYAFTATPAIFVMTPTGLMPDDDSDGMPDAWEMQMFGSLSQGANGDYDHDGLTNIAEWRAGSNPTMADTDGDGYNDKLEQQWQSSPTLASSTPLTASPSFLSSIKSYDSQSVNASDAWVVNTNVDPREGTYYWSSHYRDFLGDFDQFHSEKSRFNVNVSGWPVDGVPDSCWVTDPYQGSTLLPHGTSFGRYWNWSNVPNATASTPQTTYTGKDLHWNRCRIHLSAPLPFDLKETCLRVKVSYTQDERGYPSGNPPVTTIEPVEMVVRAGQLLGEWVNSAPTATENELVISYLVPAALIDVARINHNSAVDVLYGDTKQISGAFVPLNSDDDDYSATLSNLGSDMGQTGAIAGENDLLPIYLHSVPYYTNTKFILDIPEEIKVWKNANRTEEITSDMAIDASKNWTLYIEGRKLGMGMLRVGLFSSEEGFEENRDRIKVTVFELKGPQNVPGFSKYTYSVSSGMPTESKWATPLSGDLKSPASGTQADILWHEGPVVGKAVYSVNDNYIWDLSVNVVQVSFRNDATNSIKYGKDPVQGVANKKVILSASSDEVPAMEATLTVEKITGPTVGGKKRGEQFIEFGIIQDSRALYMQGLFQEFSPYRVWRSSLAGASPVAYVDTEGSEDFTTPWYDEVKAAHLVEDGVPQKELKLEVRDLPALSATKDLRLESDGVVDDVDRYEIVMLYRLYFAVRTIQEINEAQKIYTQRGYAEWNFDGSGNVASPPKDYRYKWTKDEFGGSAGNDKFSEIRDGSTLPITVGPKMNTMLKVQTWINEALQAQ